MFLIVGGDSEIGAAAYRAMKAQGAADADIATLRRDFSEVRWHSFSDWAREFDWSVLERTPSVA